MVVHFTKSCCGCSLRTGTILIGALSLVASALWVLLVAVPALIDPQREVSDLVREAEGPAYTIHEMQETSEEKKEEEAEIEKAVNMIKGFYIAGVVISGLEITLSSLLIVGGCTQRARFLKPWLVYHIVMVGLSFLLLVLCLSLGRVVSPEDIARVIQLLVIIPLTIYYILVVNSYHSELISEDPQLLPK